MPEPVIHYCTQVERLASHARAVDRHARTLEQTRGLASRVDWAARRREGQARAVARAYATHRKMMELAPRLGMPISVVEASLVSPATIELLKRASFACPDTIAMVKQSVALPSTMPGALNHHD